MPLPNFFHLLNTRVYEIFTRECRAKPREQYAKEGWKSIEARVLTRAARPDGRWGGAASSLPFATVCALSATITIRTRNFSSPIRACIRRSLPGNGTESNAEHRSMIRSLALFWGFPNQLSSDSWVVGFEEADHAALWIARRPMGADQRSSARARRSCGRQCSRQPAVR